MAGTNKIFKDLQDHAVNPPPGLYAKLWKKIKKLTPGNKDLQQDILPDIPAASETTITTAEEVWSSLQTYVDKENAAPVFDFKKITEALAGHKEKPVVPQKSKVLFWIYRTAAAAAVTGIIFFIYTNNAKQNQEHAEISATQKSRIIDTAKTEKVTAAVTTERNTASGKYKHKTAITQHLKNGQVTGNSIITKNVRANILNDDFLYTLASFNYKQANDFFADIKKDPRVSINNYSYVNISDKMAAFLKQQYAVNRRKNPTWKARRTKEKLNKWKRKDEANFDKLPNKNPLDILDLSEFIFKN